MQQVTWAASLFGSSNLLPLSVTEERVELTSREQAGFSLHSVPTREENDLTHLHLNVKAWSRKETLGKLARGKPREKPSP